MKKILTATTAVAVAGSFTATAQAAEYTVHAGDSLWAISQQYGTSVDSIKAENGLSSNLILPNQVLKINEKAAAPAPAKNTSVYNIIAGDTLGKIAANFNVTVAQLKAWNNLSSDLIIAGKTLYVSGPAAATHAAYQAPVAQQASYQTPAKTYQAAKAPVKTYQATVQQTSTQQAPVKTYQAPVQQQYQAPAQQQVVKTATTQTAAVSNNSGLNWAAVAACESGGNPSINTGNGYYGLYQFSLPTWQAVGGSGLPSDASAAEQTKRAQILYERAGAGQWPVCGARL